MAAITSAQSGNWSQGSTWVGGVVPGNGDSVTIASGHMVVFDVDQSGFASGLAGLTINGTLTFATDGTVTYLKMAGNITGTGSLYVGTQATPIPAPSGATPEVATIAFNGAYQITGNLANLELWGEERAPAYRIASKLDDTHIVLQADPDPGSWLRAGDVIGISDSTVQGQHSPPSETFTVAAYDPGTRTITLASSLARAVNQNGAVDTVLLISRNILATNLGKAANIGFVNGKNGGIARGVRFYNFGRGPIDNRTDWTIVACTGQNNTSGGIAYWGSGQTISNCSGQNNTYGGIAEAVWANPVRTLTQTAAEFPSLVPAGDTLVIRRGDTTSFTITGLGNLTGRDGLWFTVKAHVSFPDDKATLQIEETTGLLYVNGAAATEPSNGSITVDNESTGAVTIWLAAEETAKLQPNSSLVWDIQVRKSGVVSTLLQATCSVVADVTRTV